MHRDQSRNPPAPDYAGKGTSPQYWMVIRGVNLLSSPSINNCLKLHVMKTGRRSRRRRRLRPRTQRGSPLIAGYCTYVSTRGQLRFRNHDGLRFFGASLAGSGPCGAAGFSRAVARSALDCGRVSYRLSELAAVVPRAGGAAPTAAAPLPQSRLACGERFGPQRQFLVDLSALSA